MPKRALVLYSLFIVAVLSTGAAVWQALETQRHREQLSYANHLLATARSDARELKEQVVAAQRQVRLLEQRAGQAPASGVEAAADGDADPSTDAKLAAELAAARQQLSAAETAIVETEARLADEIAAHAALKASSQALTNDLEEARRAMSAANIKSLPAAAARLPEGQSSDPIGATGSLSDEPLTGQDGGADQSTLPPAQPDTTLQQPPKRAAVKRKTRPATNYEKPAGNIVEPLL